MNIVRRARRFVPAGLVAAGLLAAASSYAPFAATFAANGGNEVMLINVQTAKCLTIAGGVSTENNVGAVQFNCDNDPSRRWTLSDTIAGEYQIKNVQTGKCLTIAGGVST